MALIDKKILTPMRHHQDNANTVIGQASTMKALFDQGAEDLRVKLNGVIDELLATTGAQQIGIDPARGLGNTLADALTNIKNYMNLGASSISAEVIGTGSGDNVQAQLLWLKNQIQTMVLGQIPEASITLDKLAIELANKINSTDGIGDLTALTTAEKTNLVGAVNELVSQSAQIEYQTPVIVGTQIRLTKPSDNKRLFFKLETDLTGNITISLDNGATEKPLNDFEGVQLTSLDKGFVEVVAQATFFTLVKKRALKINGQDIIEGILQGSIDKFDSVYAETFGYFTKLNDPNVLPPGYGSSTAFSPDGIYLAVAHASSPFITIYKRSGDTFTKLTNPGTLPTGTGRGVAFSTDGIYLAVAHDTSPFITIYKRSGDTFTKLTNPGTLPTGNGVGTAFSPDGIYLAIATGVTPFMVIYKRTGDTFSALANPTETINGGGYGVAFSPDGNYLGYVHHFSPFFTIYKRSSDIFTKLQSPDTPPPDRGTAIAFSPNGRYVGIACIVSPYVIVYEQSGEIFSKIPEPDVLPSDAGYGIAFSQDSDYLGVSHAYSPFITIYKANVDGGKTHIYKSQNISDLQGKCGAGYLTKGGNSGDTREMVRIFK